MGRSATKASDNVYYQARIEAAKYNDKLFSREGAAELLGMSPSAVADAELGLNKVMPVDKAVMMAEVYNAPQLLNYYCLNECPIGKRLPISDEVKPIEQSVLSLINLLEDGQMLDSKRRLVAIAMDGRISPGERVAAKELVDFFEDVSKKVSEIKIFLEKSAEVENETKKGA